MKYLFKFKQFEAIGFKIGGGDNRDDDTTTIPLSSRRGKLGFFQSEDFNEKLLSLVRKLKDMADMGESGERDVAKRKLDEISRKFQVNIDKLLSDSNNKLGYKFSWEGDEMSDLDDIDRELKQLDK